MEKIGDVLNPKSDYAKLPYDETLITSVTTWGNVAIYALTIVATVMFMLDTTDCFYLGLMNGVVEIIGVAFLLVSELPIYSLPEQVDLQLRELIGFLYKPVGRLVFVLYLSFMLFGFGTFGSIMAVLMIASTVFSVYLFIKHPSTREIYHNLDKAQGENPANST